MIDIYEMSVKAIADNLIKHEVVHYLKIVAQQLLHDYENAKRDKVREAKGYFLAHKAVLQMAKNIEPRKRVHRQIHD